MNETPPDSHIDPTVHKLILERLHQAETDHDVRIVYACSKLRATLQTWYRLLRHRNARDPDDGPPIASTSCSGSTLPRSVTPLVV